MRMQAVVTEAGKSWRFRIDFPPPSWGSQPVFLVLALPVLVWVHGPTIFPLPRFGGEGWGEGATTTEVKTAGVTGRSDLQHRGHFLCSTLTLALSLQRREREKECYPHDFLKSPGL